MSGRVAARLLEQAFVPRVRELLGHAEVLHVDETPARADGGLAYVHVAATEFLTAMHTGGRSKADIDAGGVLPGYTGTLVRDGYAGYAHLTGAHHAWCGAHLLRDLAAIGRSDPDGQFWSGAMADTLTEAHQHAQAARAAGHAALAEQTLTGLRRRYRGAIAAGISDNTARAGPLARDALTPGPPVPRPRGHAGHIRSWAEQGGTPRETGHRWTADPAPITGAVVIP